MTIRKGSPVWVHVGTSDSGNPILKAGYVVNARRSIVRVKLPGTGSADFPRQQVRRA